MPLIDIACADFPSAQRVTASLGEEVREDDALSAQDAGIRQLGGLTCSWSNGVESTGLSTGPQRYELLLTVVPGPDAAEKFRRNYAVYSAHPDDGGGELYYCYNYDAASLTSYCRYDALVGGAWLQVGIRGRHVDDVSDDELEDRMRPLIADYATVVRDAGPGAAPWDPDGVEELPSDCSALLPTEFVVATLGTGPLANGPLLDGPAVSPTVSMDGIRTPATCTWYDADKDYGGLLVLHGGAWAVAELQRAGLVGEPTAVRGLGADERAYLACSSRSTCTLDLTLGGNWVEIGVDERGGSGFEGDGRAVVLALAEKLVDGTS